MDVWYNRVPDNVSRLVAALIAFGFSPATVSPNVLLQENKVFRFGVPPLRIDLLSSISGVEFQSCFAERITDVIDDVPVDIISMEHLKENKRAGSRPKDLNDLDNLP